MIENHEWSYKCRNERVFDDSSKSLSNQSEWKSISNPQYWLFSILVRSLRANQLGAINRGQLIGGYV